MNKSVFLTIAGSDPIGGAGIQADLKTADRLGLYGCSVVTAVTVQNSCGVSSIWPVDPMIIESQLLAVLEDFKPDAVKIGLLPSVEAVRTVAAIIRAFRIVNVVVDPVLAPTLGHHQADDLTVKCMVDSLFPLARLVTPNIPEAERIQRVYDKPVYDLTKSTLVKGGHSEELEMKDTLYSSNGGNLSSRSFPHIRVSTPNTHGSGCVLSSAISCFLALGYNLEDSVGKGIDFINEAFIANKNISFGKCGYGATLI